MSIKTGAVAGAVTGTVIAVLMMTLVAVRPFPPDTNASVERLTFKLCPLYALGFTNVVSSKLALAIITMAGNAVLYALVFSLVAAVLQVLKRASA